MANTLLWVPKLSCFYMEISTVIAAPNRRRLQTAFSLVEVVIAMALLATVLGALLTSFTTGFFSLQMARENLRATQVMLEKMETIRLYSWSQINQPGFIEPTFTAYYDPKATNSGLVYSGTLSWSPVPLNVPYANQMTQLTVRVDWRTGRLSRSRTVSTYIAHKGLQNYVF